MNWLKLFGKLPAMVTALVVLGCFVLLLGLNVGVVASDAVDVRGVEPNVVYGVQRLLLGQPLYTNPEAPPYSIYQYAPGLYWATHGLCRAMSISAHDPAAITQVGRALSSVINLVTFGLLAWFFVRVLRVNGLLVWTLLAFVYAFTVPFHWLVRPDSLSMVCFLGTICSTAWALHIGEDTKRGQVAIALATLSGWLSILGKQDALVGLLVLGCYVFVACLLRQISWRPLAIVIATSVVAGAVLVGATLLLGADLVALKQNLVDGVNNGVGLRFSFRRVLYPFFTSWGIIAAGLAYFIFSPKDGHCGRTKTGDFLLLSSALLLLLCTVSSLKVGTSLNKFSRFIFVSFLTLGYLAQQAKIFSKGGPSHQRGLRWAGCVLVALVLPVLTLKHWDRYRPWALRGYEDYADFSEVMGQELKSDDAFTFIGTSCIYACLFPDRAVLPHWGVADISLGRGLFKYDRLESDVRDGTVRYVVVNGKPETCPEILGIDLSLFEKKWELKYGSVFENPVYSEHE